MSPPHLPLQSQPAGTWSVAPELLADLRLKTALTALDAGDPDRALVEAEELLESHPDHRDALRTVAAAAMQMGDAALAVEAWSGVVRRSPEDAHGHASLAMARFGLADVEGALEAARLATALRPDLAEGWYAVGLALERMGDPAAAGRALDRAQALDPARYTSVAEHTEADWTLALGLAYRRLPGLLRSFFADVPVRWERFPALEELQAVDPPLSPFTDALYEGTPPVEDDPWESRPQAVRLFRGNLGRPAASVDELAARIARSLQQEALDWLGLHPDDLADLIGR